MRKVPEVITFIFGPPGTQLTSELVEDNVSRFGSDASDEWITLVHAFIAALGNPLERPNALDVISRELFDGKLEIELECSSRLHQGTSLPAVTVTLAGDPEVAISEDHQEILGGTIAGLIQAAWHITIED
jgi:hypothetical protein